MNSQKRENGRERFNQIFQARGTCLSSSPSDYSLAFVVFFLFFLPSVVFERTGKRIFAYVLSFITQNVCDQYLTY